MNDDGLSIHLHIGMTTGDVVIEAKGLCKSFGDKVLFKDLDFTIPPGAIVGIVGIYL